MPSKSAVALLALLSRRPVAAAWCLAALAPHLLVLVERIESQPDGAA